MIVSVFAIFTMLLNNATIAYSNVNTFDDNPQLISIMPEGVIMPRSGIVILEGELLQEYIRLNNIDNSNNDIVRITVGSFPSNVIEENTSQIIDVVPNLVSFDLTNIRQMSGDRIYPSTSREDVIENHLSTTNTFQRTLTGSATSGFTSSVGVSAGTVSSSLGFSVNVTTTESMNITVNVPPRSRVTVESAVRAQEFTFDVWGTNWISGERTFRGTGNAHRPWGMWHRMTQRSL